MLKLCGRFKPPKIISPRKLLEQSSKKAASPSAVSSARITIEYEQFHSIIHTFLIKENIDGLLHTLEFIRVDVENEDLNDFWELMYMVRELADKASNRDLYNASLYFEKNTLD
jgi:hypothetical protein